MTASGQLDAAVGPGPGVEVVAGAVQELEAIRPGDELALSLPVRLDIDTVPDVPGATAHGQRSQDGDDDCSARPHDPAAYCPPATVTLKARCCDACGRLRTYCRCARDVSLRARFDAVRDQAAAERRARLEQAAAWDAEQADRRFFRDRAVRGEQGTLL